MGPLQEQGGFCQTPPPEREGLFDDIRTDPPTEILIYLWTPPYPQYCDLGCEVVRCVYISVSIVVLTKSMPMDPTSA